MRGSSLDVRMLTRLKGIISIVDIIYTGRSRQRVRTITISSLEIYTGATVVCSAQIVDYILPLLVGQLV